MRRLFPLLLLLPLACGPTAPTASPNTNGATAGDVSLTPVSVSGLKDAIASHSGKVVVIDCWFLGCGPCREKFPQVMKMRRDLEADGLVLLTLDIIVDENKHRSKVLDYLREQGATNPNYILDDHEDRVDSWLFAHDAKSVPQFVVFDRAGRWVPVPDFPGKDEEKWEKEREWVTGLVRGK